MRFCELKYLRQRLEHKKSRLRQAWHTKTHAFGWNNWTFGIWWVKKRVAYVPGAEIWQHVFGLDLGPLVLKCDWDVRVEELR